MTDKLNQFKEQVTALVDTMKSLVTEIVTEENKQARIILDARKALAEAHITHNQIAEVADDGARAMDDVADYAAQDADKYAHLLDTLSAIDDNGALGEVEDSPLYTQGYEDGSDEGYSTGYEEGYNEGFNSSDAYDEGYNTCLKDHGLDEENEADEEEGE